MQVNDRLADRQAQPQPPVLPSYLRLSLLESVEETRHEVRGNANAGVGDLYHNASVTVVPRPNRDGALRPGELRRVLDQVPEDLLDAGRVRPEDRGRGSQFGIHAESLGGDVGVSTRLQGVPKHGVEVDRLVVQCELAPHDARQV